MSSIRNNAPGEPSPESEWENDLSSAAGRISPSKPRDGPATESPLQVEVPPIAPEPAQSRSQINGDPATAAFTPHAPVPPYNPSRSETPDGGHDTPAHVGRTEAGTGQPPTSSEATASPIPGLERRYKFIKQIGSGGFGIVWAVLDLRFTREVALKYLKPECTSDPTACERFDREAGFLADLAGEKGFLQVHERHDQGDVPRYIVMQLIRGDRLSDLLRLGEDKRPSLETLLGYFAQVCRAVARMHRKGVVHRDLKPSNLMVEQEGVFIVDFGLAKRISDRAPPPADGAPPSREDHTQGHHGTPNYQPPEQANGRIEQIGPPSDIFCLGGILCEILTGSSTYPAAGDPRCPGEGEPRDRARAGELKSTYSRLARCGKNPALIALAKSCLQAEPASRPSVTDIVRTVESILRPRTGVLTRLVLVVVMLAVGGLGAWACWAYLAPASPSQSADRNGEQLPPVRGQEPVDPTDGARRYDADMEEAMRAYRAGDVDKVKRLLTLQETNETRQAERHAEWYLLDHLVRDGPRKYTASSPIVEFTPDGRMITIEGKVTDQDVVVTDIPSGKKRRVGLHLDNTATLALSPDGSRFALIGFEAGNHARYVLKIGSLGEKTEPTSVVLPLEAARWQVSFTPDGTAVVANGGEKWLGWWDATTGKLLGSFQSKEGIHLAAFSRDRRRIAVVDSLGSATILSSETRAVVCELGRPWTVGAPTAVALSHDGNKLACGLVDQNQVTAIQWLEIGSDFRTNRTIPSPHKIAVTSLSFAADGMSLASGGEDTAVRLWSLPDGLGKLALSGHKDSVIRLTFDPHSLRLATAEHHGVHLWDLAERPVYSLPGTTWVESHVDQGRGRLAYVAMQGSAVRVADARTGQPVRDITPPTNGRVTSLYFSPTGKELGLVSFVSEATGQPETVIHCRQVLDGNLAFPEIRYRGKPSNVVSNGDGSQLYFGASRLQADGTRGELVEYDVPNRRPRVIASGGDEISCVAVCGERREVAWCAANTVHIQNTDPGGQARALTRPAAVLQIAYSRDGDWLAAGGLTAGGIGAQPNTGSLCVWDTKRWVCHELGKHESVTSAVAFSPDGLRLLTGGSDGSIRLWDTRTWQEVGALPGLEEYVTRVSFSADGGFIAAAGLKSTVRVFKTSQRPADIPDGRRPGVP